MSQAKPRLGDSQEQWVYLTHLRLHRKICSVNTARRNLERLRSGVLRDAVQHLMVSEFADDHPQEILAAEPIFRRLMSLDAEYFVPRAYKVVLSRAADPQGVQFYERRISAGVAPAQVLLELLNSEEARSAICSDEPRARVHGELAELCKIALGGSGQEGANIPLTWRSFIFAEREEFVRIAYQCILGRNADRPGVEFYAAELARGRSRFSMLLALATSVEAQSVARSQRRHWLLRFLHRCRRL